MAGSTPQARRAGYHSCCADEQLEVNVVSNAKQSLLDFSFKSTALSVKTQLYARGK